MYFKLIKTKCNNKKYSIQKKSLKMLVLNIIHPKKIFIKKEVKVFKNLKKQIIKKINSIYFKKKFHI